MRLFILSALAHLLFAAALSAPALPAEAAVSELRFPLAFAENRGQFEPEVRFLGMGHGYSVALTERSARVAVSLRPGGAEAGNAPRRWASSVLDLSWPEARPLEIRGRRPLGSSISFFSGNDPGRWRRRLPEYGAAEYRNLWPGIDLIFYESPRGRLAYDFVVAPGADPARIRIEVGGADRLGVTPDGGLRAVLPSGEVWHSAPRVFQETPTGRREVDGSFVLLAENGAGFRLGPYSESLPLVIDPELAWSTSLPIRDTEPGGFLNVRLDTQAPGGIAENGSGQIYVAYDHGFEGILTGIGVLDTQVVVRRLSGGGKIQRTAVINGTDPEFPGAIAFHPDVTLPALSDAAVAPGAVYVAGNTFSKNWPVVRPIQEELDCPAIFCYDGFLALFDPDLEEILFSTFLGGNEGDRPLALAVDGQGRAYLTGTTRSKNYPRSGPTQKKLKKKRGFGAGAFVSVIDPRLATQASTASGNDDALVFSTFYATKDKKSREEGRGIGVDSRGLVHVVGEVDSKKKVRLVDPIQAVKRGRAELFLAVWDLGDATAAGRRRSAAQGAAAKPALVFSTYFGGEGDDRPRGLAVGPDDRTYVVGETDSERFPLSAPVQAELAGETDAFVAVFDLDVASATPTAFPEVAFSTYFGGSGADRANAVAVDRQQTIHFGGSTLSTDFPVASPIQAQIRPDDRADDESCATPCSDAFFARLGGLPATGTLFGAASLDLDFSTYLGSGASDSVQSLAVDRQGNTYLIGSTRGLNFPGKGAWKKHTETDRQVFVARIDR